jgi:hypothetical protein
MPECPRLRKLGALAQRPEFLRRVKRRGKRRVKRRIKRREQERAALRERPVGNDGAREQAGGARCAEKDR